MSSSAVFSQEQLAKGRRCILQEKNPNLQGRDVFLELHENRRGQGKAKGRSQRQELSHRPSINSISRDIVAGTNFHSRLAGYQQERERKLQQLQAQQTKQAEGLYRPKTGQAPRNRNLENLPIGDFLYSRRRKTVLLAKPQPIPLIS
jgi:hypothetical protein